MRIMNKHYTAYTDENILALISENNDTSAFRELYDRYFQLLFNYTYSKLQEEFAAQEVVQELFVGIWQQRSNHTIQSCRPYLFSAAKNLIISYYRKELTRQKHYDKWETYQSDIYLFADQDILTADLQKRYEKGLIILPEKCREVFTLSRKGIPNKRIAMQLGISEKTVEQHITKALRILRDHLKEHLPYLLILVQLSQI